MNRCPKCGAYMSSHLQSVFGGARVVWNCSCGYSTEHCSTGMTYSNRTETSTKYDRGKK